MTYRADRCLIASAENACWSCGEIGKVVCLVLPHDLKVEPDGSGDKDLEPPFEGAMVMHYVEQIAPELQAAINVPGFKAGTSRTAQTTYYANHCEHCGVLQGDHYLHKPDGPFWPMFPEDSSIAVSLVQQPVWVRAGSCGTVSFSLGEYEESFEGPPREPPPRRTRKKK